MRECQAEVCLGSSSVYGPAAQLGRLLADVLEIGDVDRDLADALQQRQQRADVATFAAGADPAVG